MCIPAFFLKKPENQNPKINLKMNKKESAFKSFKRVLLNTKVLGY